MPALSLLVLLKGNFLLLKSVSITWRTWRFSGGDKSYIKLKNASVIWNSTKWLLNTEYYTLRISSGYEIDLKYFKSVYTLRARS